MASNIKVILRIRPSGRVSKAFTADLDEGQVNFEFDKASPDGQVNNSKTAFKFKFDAVLGMKVTQEEVFNVVAKPVIEDVLKGINGTIFAYGQTGSGKTFTITGGSERYADRGLIPRTIAYMFECFRRGDASYRMYVSYLEIYNNDGYDLLSREDGAQKLEDLPKVQLREDEDQNIHLRNLSVNTAQKEEDALNLLFLGDTNRVVAETPMNDASTRSHCMFILWVDSTQPGSDTVRRAKLHLVDLAGSERISKTGVEGNLQKEARYINLSLHYLEQVIVALQERSKSSRVHVPYRNSMMTSVLRDSLGGNCKTVMVGTMAVEDPSLDESISTCRFAQRVAMIKNNAIVNEELDAGLLVKRLKKEVTELKSELKLLNGDDEEEEMTNEIVQDCRGLVSEYLESHGDSHFVCASTQRFRECFRLLREIYWQRQSAAGAQRTSDDLISTNTLQVGASRESHSQGNSATPQTQLLEAQVHELKQQVAKRDEELGVLMTSLSRRNKAKDAQAAMKDGRVFIRGSRPPKPEADVSDRKDNQHAASSSHVAQISVNAEQGHAGGDAQSQVAGRMDETALFLDRNHAFEIFRKSVRRTEVVEEGRMTVQQLKAEAKSLGESANTARAAVQTAMAQVEKLRVQRAMTVTPPRSPESDRLSPASLNGPEAAPLLQEIDKQKKTYQQCMQRLNQVKGEIEQLQASAEQNKQRLHNDFEAWYVSYVAHQRATGGALPELETANVTPHAALVGSTSTCSSSPPAKIPQPKRNLVQPMASSTETVDTLSTPGQKRDALTRARPDSTGRGCPSSYARAQSSDSQLLGAKDQLTGPSQASGSSKPQSGASPRRPLSSQESSSQAAGAAINGILPVKTETPKMTGDAQTDDEIAAFYAAFAAAQAQLQK